MSVLADGPGQLQEVEGVLIARTESTMYKGNYLYVIQTPDGEELTIGGTAALNARLCDGDVGKLVRLEFTGWGESKSGKFKQISVSVWKDAPASGQQTAAAADGNDRGDGLPF